MAIDRYTIDRRGHSMVTCNLCNHEIVIIDSEVKFAVRNENLMIVCIECLNVLDKHRTGIIKLR